MASITPGARILWSICYKYLNQKKKGNTINDESQGCPSMVSMRHSRIINASYTKVVDESMSAIILDHSEGVLNLPVLYFPQYRTTGDRLQ